MSESLLSDVLVIGAFRSGTNLMKLLLETGYHVRCVFNQLGWKHALAPTLVARASHSHPELPMVVMVKEPVQHNVSLYRHWRRTRPGLVGQRSFSEFIRSELVVHDRCFGGRAPKYLFATPTDYWNQYYFSYIFWDDVAPSTVLVRLDQLQRHPEQVLAGLEAKFSLRRRVDGCIRIPDGTVAPSADDSPSRVNPADPDQESFEVPEADRTFIESRVARVVFERIFGSSLVSAVSGSARRDPNTSVGVR